MDAHVQETSHHRPEHKEYDRPKMERNGGPELRVEDGSYHSASLVTVAADVSRRISIARFGEEVRAEPRPRLE